MRNHFDIIVVGAGHAGCEAAVAAARMEAEVLLITHDLNRVAQMSCNPAMGGIAKGQIVREIDALGGCSGLVADATSIQFRMLNRSKGPAMWSPRAQIDRTRFIDTWRQQLDATPRLSLWQDDVDALLIENGHLQGVHTRLWGEIRAERVILTCGTFLGGLMHFGQEQIVGGRIAEPASFGLSRQLYDLGFAGGRMKTGTPPRIDARSVDFSLCEEQEGDPDFGAFSFLSFGPNSLRPRSCFITYTNPEVHDLLRGALDESPLYNGQIESIGPRYCPSIETKIVTFAERDRHPLFLEPEGETTMEYYLNGFSSSLPIGVQLAAMRKVPALRDVHMLKPGYAIEYDFFVPTQLKHTLETLKIPNLYLAGQINGTTGYEEAAGQGLVAGINAALSLHSPGKEFVLGRDEAYIGVLIDDLVTKGVDEPYRMFTSRAEFRTLLRGESADRRLTPYAVELGLASQERSARFKLKRAFVEDLIAFAHKYSVSPGRVNGALEALGQAPIRHAQPLFDVLLRPATSWEWAASLLPEVAERVAVVGPYPADIIEQAEVEIKYHGYIARERAEAEKLQRLERIRLPRTMDYLSINSLATEARQKLAAVQPETIGQAARIPGVSPHDISILLVLCGR